MEQQKYFRGNLLKLKYGHAIWVSKSDKTEKPNNIISEDDSHYIIDISPEWADKEVVIKGSYGDLYGKAHSGGGYSVAFLDGSNEVSWIDESQMEFIDKGGEHLFDTINSNKLNRLLEKSIVVLEVIEDKSTDKGSLFVVRTNKPMEVGSVYKGRYDVEDNYIYNYMVVSKHKLENTYTIAPVVDKKQECVVYFDDFAYSPKNM